MMFNPFKRKIKKRNEAQKKAEEALKVMLALDFDEILCSGYISLDKCPEVIAGCRKIAEMISTMTIYLMANTERGDIRVKNELSKKLDITPSAYMTRKTWVEAIVMNMLLYGKGNAVVIPHTTKGLLGELEIVTANRVSFARNVGSGYSILIDGAKVLDPAETLHFVFNPDKNNLYWGQGLKVSLKELTDNLAQARATEKAFMNSKWKPSVVVKVDGLTDEFASPEGRKKLLDEYLSTSEAGEPWLIPAEQFAIDQIRPLSLSDLAINDTVQIDKRAVASLLGVPAFALGVGEYNKDEWDAFVNNTIRPIAKGIEQELTRKLLISDKMYFTFNIASLYSYDLEKTANVFESLYTCGVVTKNELREKINMSPVEGGDEFIILENYIPADRIGDQNKLGGNN